MRYYCIHFSLLAFLLAAAAFSCRMKNILTAFSIFSSYANCSQECEGGGQVKCCLYTKNCIEHTCVNMSLTKCKAPTAGVGGGMRFVLVNSAK